MTAAAGSALLRFLAGRAPDAQGRTLAQIWAWDDDRLERVHDYIQWLFPLPEPSRFNDDAPLLTGADIAGAAADAGVRDNLRRSLRRMLAFYGLALDAGGRCVVRGPGFAVRSAHWLTPGNHNFLRLSRILRSLTLLGLGSEARALLAALETLRRDGGTAIGERSLAFWRAAVNGPPP